MTDPVTRLHPDLPDPAPAGAPETPPGPDPDTAATMRAVAAEMAACGLSQAVTARGLGVSSTTLHRWLKGDYEGDVARVSAKARAWLETRSEARALTLTPAGLDTHAGLSLTEEVMAALAHAQATGDVVLIHGRSGAGKSWALKSYAAARAQVTVLTVTCGITSLHGLYGRIARGLGAGGRFVSALEAEDAILARLEGRHALLAIDEAQHLSARLIDALRGLRDLSGCGLALLGDETLRMTLGRCPQVTGRIGVRVGLGVPGEADVTTLLETVLGRTPSGAERRCAQAAVAAPGGMHALRRLMARAFMIARADERTAITPDDIAAAAAGMEA